MDSLPTIKTKILGRVTLQQVVGEATALKKQSGRMVGLCPFHNEKSPSFYVFDDHYYCFGCKASGDLFNFVGQTQGLTFFDSLKFLAHKYQIEIPELERRRAGTSGDTSTQSFYKAMLAAQELFSQELQTERGKAACTYLKERGFTDENLVKFGFGLTPEKPWELTETLKRRDIKELDLVALSLSSISQKTSRAYDFFRNRIIIPIHDSLGRLIAFGGRTTDDNPAKYKNSANTPLFEKSHILFNFHRAKEAIKLKKRVILVEGYMDALCLASGGFAEVVASMGTAFSQKQLQSIAHVTDNLIVVFDGDQAGQRATLDMIDLVLEFTDLNVKVARLPAGIDPDQFLRQNSPEAFEQFLQKESLDIVSFCIKNRLSHAGVNNIPKIVKDEFIPWLAKFSHDPIKKSFLINKLAQWTEISATDLNRSLNNISRENQVQKNIPAAAVVVVPLKRPSALYIECFLILAHAPNAEIPEELLARIGHSFRNEELPWQEVLSELVEKIKLKEALKSGAEVHFESQDHASVKKFLDYIQSQTSRFATINWPPTFKRMSETLQKDDIRSQISLLKSTLKLSQGSADERSALIRSIQSLTAELHVASGPQLS